MSFGYFKSLQTISTYKEWEEHVRSELNIVHSYLNIDEWKKEQTFADVLQDKILMASTLKQKLMKLHGINDPKDIYGFRCQVCTSVFDQPTALGGHMSKAHPNYRKGKMQRVHQQIRESSIQRIKKEESIHYEATRIHREDFDDEVSCEN